MRLYRIKVLPDGSTETTEVDREDGPLLRPELGELLFVANGGSGYVCAADYQTEMLRLSENRGGDGGPEIRFSECFFTRHRADQ